MRVSNKDLLRGDVVKFEDGVLMKIISTPKKEQGARGEFYSAMFAPVKKDGDKYTTTGGPHQINIGGPLNVVQRG